MLRLRPDGTFTLVQLTDLHLKDGGPEDRRTLDLVAAVLASEGPDLAVLTGDVVCGAESPDPSHALALVGELLINTPWCLLFGNHDAEGSLDAAGLLAVAQRFPTCLTEAGPGDLPGLGNQRLPVVDDSGQTQWMLTCLDSHGNAPPEVGGYAWIEEAQVAWYRRACAETARDLGQAPPGLVFLHIPLPEFASVWRTRPCRGRRLEAVCCPRRNSGLFAALRQCGEAVAVFAGHDHLNDYEGELGGVRLCYGRATGYNTYGREGFPRGARLVRLHGGSRRWESWLRLEGDVVEEELPLHHPERPLPPAGSQAPCRR